VSDYITVFLTEVKCAEHTINNFTIKRVHCTEYIYNTVQPQPLVSECFHSAKNKTHWALVAHTCNPSYLGGGDQEDGVLRPAQAISVRGSPHLQNKHRKMGWRCGSSDRVPALQV
jgi:hypothetical protein